MHPCPKSPVLRAMRGLRGTEIGREWNALDRLQNPAHVLKSDTFVLYFGRSNTSVSEFSKPSTSGSGRSGTLANASQCDECSFLSPPSSTDALLETLTVCFDIVGPTGTAQARSHGAVVYANDSSPQWLTQSCKREGHFSQPAIHSATRAAHRSSMHGAQSPYSVLSKGLDSFRFVTQIITFSLSQAARHEPAPRIWKTGNLQSVIDATFPSVLGNSHGIKPSAQLASLNELISWHRAFGERPYARTAAVWW
ncbi:hypothetical protein C8R45DRAFT_922756 [Mycena sanguinolenta]|nr:hypothetical protein C8R45DRAFT_922756 [Mycena sanguinolenta]